MWSGIPAMSASFPWGCLPSQPVVVALCVTGSGGCPQANPRFSPHDFDVTVGVVASVYKEASRLFSFRTYSLRMLGVGAALVMALGSAPGCYSGGERDKDPPPGLPGGLCLAPDGHCQEGQCNRDRNFCFNPADPCDGFFCGGDDRGLCVPDFNTLEPSCQCGLGYNNEQYALYCCPDPSLGIFDPNCTEVPGDDGDPGDASTAAAEEDSSGGGGSAGSDGGSSSG